VTPEVSVFVTIARVALFLLGVLLISLAVLGPR